MELRHLRYFLAVAEEGQFTRAAERLAMQQPPLSQQIRTLEEEIGFELFVRMPRGVTLTPAGQAFAEDAQRLLLDLQQSVDKAHRIARGELGTISIGLTSSAAFHPFTTETIRAFRAVCPEVAVELAAHCRRRMVANLVRTSPVLLAVDPVERPPLVETFETSVFEKGERLITEGEEPSGLHLIASGEVAVVGHEAGEPFVIATLGVGEVVGEVALVLRRKANADVVAVHPTVTLHLPREDFLTLIRDHPAILQGLYMLAVKRDEETSGVLENSTTSVAEDYVLV